MDYAKEFPPLPTHIPTCICRCRGSYCTISLFSPCLLSYIELSTVTGAIWTMLKSSLPYLPTYLPVFSAVVVVTVLAVSSVPGVSSSYIT